MIVRGVLVLPSMPKGEIVDQRLSLMLTQEAPGANPILNENFNLPKLIYSLSIILFMVSTCRDVSVDIWHAM